MLIPWVRWMLFLFFKIWINSLHDLVLEHFVYIVKLNSQYFILISFSSFSILHLNKQHVEHFWAVLQVVSLPTARVMTPSWSRISRTTWLFCSGVDLQQMTALHLQLSSRKLLFRSSCRAQSSVRPSMTRIKLGMLLDDDSPWFSAAVKLSSPRSTSNLSSFSKAIHSSWWRRNPSIKSWGLTVQCILLHFQNNYANTMLAITFYP